MLNYLINSFIWFGFLNREFLLICNWRGLLFVLLEGWNLLDCFLFWRSNIWMNRRNIIYYTLIYVILLYVLLSFNLAWLKVSKLEVFLLIILLFFILRFFIVITFILILIIIHWFFYLLFNLVLSFCFRYWLLLFKFLKIILLLRLSQRVILRFLCGRNTFILKFLIT